MASTDQSQLGRHCKTFARRHHHHLDDISIVIVVNILIAEDCLKI